MKNIRTVPAFVREIPANVDETRTIDFVITSAKKDRHSTILNPEKWEMENFRANPVVFYQHYSGSGLFQRPDPDMLIAKAVNLRKEGGEWVSGVHFEPSSINKMAEKIFQKVKFGTLRAASVCFMEIGEGKFGEGEEARGEKNETYYFESQELLEFSIVNIPSNPAAVAREGYKDPTVAEVLAKYIEYCRKFDESKVKEMSIVDLLRAMEGIIKLDLPVRKVEEKKLLKLAEARLRILSR